MSTNCWTTSAALSASGEVKPISQWSSAILYHCAPACQDRSTRVLGSSPAMLKILTFSSFFCTALPAAMTSSQVNSA
ncbi:MULTISPECIES: hypothetical protein [Streptomyces]|uniref:hypothetical protein n=1 Tax=Streptomyces TaxID=1883 RepID=UPI001ABF2594|nr:MULTISPECIES: hypothetical protein [Streptomyces]MDI5909282.1 hypothetical protein [Streptomyces sp. 12257]